MNTKLKKSLLVVAIGSLFAASAAQATNGYFSEGTGAKNRALGGAGTALAQETGSIEMNPAAAVNMDPRMDVGAGLFSPADRGYTISGNDCSAGVLGPFACPAGPDTSLDASRISNKTGFLIPFYGQNFAIDNTSSWAITVSALGGMNTNYTVNPFQEFGGAGRMGIDLKQVKIGGTYARKIDSKLSVGATLSLIVQRFEAIGLNAFAGLSTGFVSPGVATNLSNNGVSTSTGIGLNLGATYKVNNDVTVAVTYSPEADMSKFDEYKSLFAEGGDFNIPSNYSLGVAWNVMPKVLVSAGYRRINYTDVPSISNDSQRATDICGAARSGFIPQNATTEATCLGGSNGGGFGWDDMDIFKVGVQWEQTSDVTLRAGWNHGKSPIRTEDVTFNVIAPATVEDHLAVGGTMKLNASSEITVDYIRTLNNSVSGVVPAGFGGGDLVIEMEQNFIELQYGKKF